MPHLIIGKPDASEYAPNYGMYISLVEGDDVLAALADTSVAELRSVSEEASLTRYAPGKWSLREVLGHVIDAERPIEEVVQAVLDATANSIKLRGIQGPQLDVL